MTFTITWTKNPKNAVLKYLKSHFDEILDFEVSKGYSIQLRFSPEKWNVLDAKLKDYFDGHEDKDYYDYYKHDFGTGKYFKNTNEFIAQVLLDSYMVLTKVVFDNDDVKNENTILFVNPDVPKVIKVKFKDEITRRNKMGW